MEENGHVVSGLTSEDFTILDEDQPQPVASFNADSGSIRLVLLLDASGSTCSPLARQLAQTGLAAMAVLHPDDMVALMTFDRKATVRVPFTADRNAVIAGVSKITGKPLGGSTDIYHSLSDAAKYLGKSTDAPNVILILTDNAARADTTEASTLRDLWAASTSVNAMVVSSAPMWDEKSFAISRWHEVAGCSAYCGSDRWRHSADTRRGYGIASHARKKPDPLLTLLSPAGFAARHVAPSEDRPLRRRAGEASCRRGAFAFRILRRITHVPA